MTLADEVRSRLPWEAAGVVYYAAERHGLELLIDDDFEERCLDMLVQHLLLHAGGHENPSADDSSEDDARLLLAALGDGLPYWAVMVGEGFVSHLATRGDELGVYRDWVAA